MNGATLVLPHTPSCCWQGQIYVFSHVQGSFHRTVMLQWTSETTTASKYLLLHVRQNYNYYSTHQYKNYKAKEESIDEERNNDSQSQNNCDRTKHTDVKYIIRVTNWQSKHNLYMLFFICLSRVTTFFGPN